MIIPKGPVLVVLVGSSGAGKSTFAAKHFKPEEVVSTDALRKEYLGSPQELSHENKIYDEFFRRIAARLGFGKRVVADSMAIKNGDRRRIAEIGIMLNVPVIYVVIDRPLIGKMQTGGWRSTVRRRGGKSLVESTDVTFNANLVQIMMGDSDYFGKGHTKVIDLRDTDTAKVAEPLSRTNTLHDLVAVGYDTLRVVGDIHGNLNGLNQALNVSDKTHVLFLGDITDYGSQSWPCVDIVNQWLSEGRGTMVRGNHDHKIYRYVDQTNTTGEFNGVIGYGNDVTVNQLKQMNSNVEQRCRARYLSMVNQAHDWVQIGNWMFAHGAIHKGMIDNPANLGVPNSSIEHMALYGQSDGTKDDLGRPNRLMNWHDDMPQGMNAMVGHSILSVDEPVVFRNDVGSEIVYLDTGSSKDLDGVPGKLSWVDFTFDMKRNRLVREAFQSET